MMLQTGIDAHFMQQAIKEATIAAAEKEVPIGAVVVCQGRIIAKAYNQCERLKDSSAHAEMLAMTAAAAHLGNKYLSDCSLYVTLEPCAMCAAAMRWAQLERLIYSAPDRQRGFTCWKPSLLHPRTSVVQGIAQAETETILCNFFKEIRN